MLVEVKWWPETACCWTRLGKLWLDKFRLWPGVFCSHSAGNTGGFCVLFGDVSSLLSYFENIGAKHHHQKLLFFTRRQKLWWCGKFVFVAVCQPHLGKMMTRDSMLLDSSWRIMTLERLENLKNLDYGQVFSSLFSFPWSRSLLLTYCFEKIALLMCF